MEFPIELQMLINDYARPIWTRPDWRKGSNIMRTLRLRVGNGNWNPEYYCHFFRDQILNKYRYSDRGRGIE